MTIPVRSYGERWHGYQSPPRPPREIETEMMAAGRDGDDVRLGLAKARYEAWLTDQGWTSHQRSQGRPPRADEAAR